MAQVTLCASIDAAGKAAASNGTVRVAGIVYTTVAANIATLVADGASPTQAHVTTLNGNWTLLKTLVDAATAQVSANMVVTIDLANIGSISKLRAAFNALLDAAKSTGEFTS